MVAHWFREIGDFDTIYPHQIKVAEAFQRGKSVLLRAPTGSGKTEAVVIPFLKLKGESLPNMLVYSLPMRVLVEDIGERIKRYSEKLGLNLSIHHGVRIEDPMFRSDIIVTTIDQVVASYTCTPLSFSKKHGNIPAGAIATSILVFDEIQLLDPEFGLQTALILTKHAIESGFPIVIMTATLPNIFIEKIVEETSNSFEIIDDVEEKDIPWRAMRNVKLCWDNNILTSEEIEKIYNDYSNGRMIVICNTVKKAQDLYRNLRVPQKYLLHSRFLDKDRKDKEEAIKQIFGKDANGEGILITTQVVEAGMDISSPLILSEIAPIDSIIQRAGRCARWGGEGKLVVYKTEDTHPYLKKLIEGTEKILVKNNGALLNWDLEKTFVDEILEEVAEEKWLNLDTRGHIIALLSEAAFKGERNLTTKAIRSEFTCEVSLHRDPYSLGNDVIRLERIKIPLWTLRKWIDEFQPTVWEIEESNIISDDMKIKWYPSLISGSESILPFRHYILSSERMGYTKNLGLILGETGEDFSLKELRSNEEFKEFSYERESWIKHSEKTEIAIKKLLLDFYFFEVNMLSKTLGIKKDEFIKLILNIAKLHDLGKLNKRWQDLAGWDGKSPLAHSDKEELTLPPHATVSAKALSKWACSNFKNKKLYEAIILAIAHHHSLKSSHYKEYNFIPGWKEILLKCNIDHSIVESIIPEVNTSYHLPISFPDFNNVHVYRTYTFISRILKFADWIATGGKDALLHIKNWYANV